MTDRIDAHHHVWRADRTPWLSGPIEPKIFGDYAPIRRDYTVDEFITDASASGVTGSVFVQANVAHSEEVDEVAWVASQSKGFIRAVVGFADLSSPGLGETLDRQTAVSPLRGIRQQVHWHARPDYRFAKDPAVFAHPDFHRGLVELSRRGLHFELQVFPSQFTAAMELIDAAESVRFVLVHSGMPEDLSEGGRAVWANGLSELAERPNVVTKISGLGTFARAVVASDWKYIVNVAVDAFGPDRSMFGSNFPIEKLWTDYSTLVRTVDDALVNYSEDERADIWRGTAERTYHLGPEPMRADASLEKERI